MVTRYRKMITYVDVHFLVLVLLFSPPHSSFQAGNMVLSSFPFLDSEAALRGAMRAHRRRDQTSASLEIQQLQ